MYFGYKQLLQNKSANKNKKYHSLPFNIALICTTIYTI